jgi:predicted NBD/HSP70 family sugar kinase
MRPVYRREIAEQPPEPYLREVFTAIAKKENGLSRAQIEQKTGLPDQAVKNAISTLVDRGFIDAASFTGPAPSFSGPAPSLHQVVSIIRGKFCVIGLKILPSEVLGVVTDLRCRVLRIGGDGEELTATKDLPGGRHDEEHVVRTLAELVQELVERIPEGYSVLGTGVELGGHVVGGIVVYSPNLGWRDVPLGQRLEEVLPMQLKSAHHERSGQTGFPVVIENDANALAVEAQWFGAGSERRSFAVVLVGDGIGCGLVINNELVRGVRGAAGEIGHLVIAPENRSLICRCGNRGCLEAIATLPMILQSIAWAKKAYGKDPPATIADAVKLAEEGDELAREAFEVAGDALARAISYLLNLVNPEALILETYEPKVTQLLMQTVKKRLQRYCFSTARTDTDIPIMDVALERGAKGAAAVMITGLLSQELPADTLVSEAP